MTFRMKKFIITILAFLYISSTTGATVHFHYCMGELVQLGLWHSESNKCGECGMEKNNAKPNSCCKDEHKQIKIEKDQKATAAIEMLQLIANATPASIIEIPLDDLSSVTEENPLSHAPPRNSDVAVYIRNCVFRI